VGGGVTALNELMNECFSFYFGFSVQHGFSEGAHGARAGLSWAQLHSWATRRLDMAQIENVSSIDGVQV
jgi:hypothetical protein